MSEKYLYETLEAIDSAGLLTELPDYISANLSPHIELRDYQEKAFRHFITYAENNDLRKNKQLHTLFHMATGSGKTVLMAGLIFYLYAQGYRNFLQNGPLCLGSKYRFARCRIFHIQTRRESISVLQQRSNYT